jgi:hypothetical protein
MEWTGVDCLFCIALKVRKFVDDGAANDLERSGGSIK